MMTSRSVAIVVPGLGLGGGVPSLAMFLYQAIREYSDYRPEVISLATSATDASSVRLVSPGTWSRGVSVSGGVWRGVPFRHVGAEIVEFEFQRYQPRHRLTQILNRYDLVQIVAGFPAWAAVAEAVAPPVCLFAATTVRRERAARLRRARGWRRCWLQLMTDITARLERRAAALVAWVFAESHYTLNILRPLVPPDRLSLGVPGVRTEIFHPGPYQLDGYILSVGRFSDPRKNVRLLFRAYRLLALRNLSAPRLVLAGGAPAPEDWAYARDLGIDSAVDVYTDVTEQELAELYRRAGMFVLSSDEEGLGIVILEAMASGLPVVATRCGGPETAILEGETGYLTPVGDSVRLAECIATLLEDPQRRARLAQASRERAIEHFSVQAAGRAYLAKYEALLKC